MTVDVHLARLETSGRESEVIRVTSYAGGPAFLVHTIGRLGAVKTTIAKIENEVFERLKTTVSSTPFLSMDTWPGMWGVDADRYVFEWCSGSNYYAVEREQGDTEIEIALNRLFCNWFSPYYWL